MEEAKNPKHSRKSIVDGSEISLDFNGTKISFKYNKADNSITIGDKVYKVDPKEGQAGIRKKVAEKIEEIRSEARKGARNSKTQNKQDMKVFLENIRKLKKQGFLKQGGSINNPYIDNVIEDFFKNNNI